MKKILLYLQAIFYIGAGCNHFRKPLSYEAIMPAFLPLHALAVLVSGIAEVILGAMLLFGATRRTAAYGIVWLLLVFIPVHIYYIQMGSCLPGLCFPGWVGWVRLLIVHPILLAWAWWYRK